MAVFVNVNTFLFQNVICRFLPSCLYVQVVTKFKSPNMSGDSSGLQKETQVNWAELLLLHFLSVSYLCLEITAADSFLSLDRRRLDFTMKTKYPAFLPKVLLAATCRSIRGKPRNPPTRVPRTNKANEVRAAALHSGLC